MVSKQLVLVINVLDPGEMVRNKDRKNFDEGKIVTACQLGQSISETARLVGCSRSAVVRRYKTQRRDRVLGSQGSFTAQEQ